MQPAVQPTQQGNVNPAWRPQDGTSPFNVNTGAPGIGDFQRFSDNAYAEAERRLNPQFDQRQRSFEQDMVNRGIAPGTPAYDNARANFDQSRNDAFASARAQADQFGLAAQNQAFQQGATNSQGLRELILGQLAADTSRYGADASANASMSNAATAANTAANNLAWQQQQGDFSNLMQLLGFSQGTQGFNNQANAQQFNMNSGILGLLGQGSPIPGLDVTSGYNNQYNAQLNQANMQQQQNNANNQNYAQMFAAIYCDRNAKDTVGPMNADDTLDAVRSLPLDRWKYKGSDTPHIGTYAQEFNAKLGLPEAPFIGLVDMMGAILGSVQALANRIEALEAR